MAEKRKFKFCSSNLIVDNIECSEKDTLIIENAKMFDEYVNFINTNNIEKIYIELDDLSILRRCPGVKHVSIKVNENTEYIDFQPLYDHAEIKEFSRGINPFPNELDYTKINGLEYVYIYSPNRKDKNYRKIKTLKSLSLSSDKLDRGNLSTVFESDQLDSLKFMFSSLKSLDGIERSKKMQSVVLDTCRSLEDISALEGVKDTLKALVIQASPRIKEFSVLEKLENLEALLIMCTTTNLENLQFLTKLKKLKVFMFTANVIDGDITPCKNIPYTYLVKGRKHYNLKEKDLPLDGEAFTRGLDGIPPWRALSW